MDIAAIGKWLALAGLMLVVVGGLIWLAGRWGLPLGRLPGDIRIRRDGTRIYIPIVTSIVLSVILTLLLNLLIRLFRR